MTDTIAVPCKLYNQMTAEIHEYRGMEFVMGAYFRKEENIDQAYVCSYLKSFLRKMSADRTRWQNMPMEELEAELIRNLQENLSGKLQSE